MHTSAKFKGRAQKKAGYTRSVKAANSLRSAKQFSEHKSQPVLSPIKGSDDQPFSAKALTVPPGGIETSVLRNIISPESVSNVFAFNTTRMRII